MSEMASRFTVGDPVCGHLAEFRTRKEALLYARNHWDKGCHDVQVFDRLARKGCAQVWTAFGSVVGEKQ